MVAGDGFAVDRDLAGDAMAFVKVARRKYIIGRDLRAGYREAVKRVTDNCFDVDILMQLLSVW